MDINVNVTNQKLHITTNLKSLVAGSQEFVKFKFNLSGDWSNLTVSAQFAQGSTGYNVALDANNSCYLPSELTPGLCTLMLFGSASGSNVKGTTNAITLRIDDNHFIADASSTEITQTQYDEICALVNESMDVTDPTFAEAVQTQVALIMQSFLDEGYISYLAIADGSVTNAKLNSNVANYYWKKNVSSTSTPTTNSWEATYDPTGRATDMFTYIDENGNHAEIITYGSYVHLIASGTADPNTLSLDPALSVGKYYLRTTTMSLYSYDADYDLWDEEFDAETGESSLVPSPDTKVDYYILDEYSRYEHFRYINNRFEQIGISSYTRAEIDYMLDNIEAGVQDVEKSSDGKALIVTYSNGTTSRLPLPSGGGDDAVVEKQVNLVDYDGSLMHSYTRSEFLQLNEMPSNPSHAGLTSMGWNWTLEHAQAQLSLYIDDQDTAFNIGQMYTNGTPLTHQRNVVFVDYDGTIVQAYNEAQFMALSSMPSNPSHSGLTAQGWNWTLADAKLKLSTMEDGTLTIGQMYLNSSGKTDIDITIANSLRKRIYLSLAISGTIVVTWGDGSSSVYTSSSLSQIVYKDHAYSNLGNYTISISVSSGTYRFMDSNGGFINGGVNATVDDNKGYSSQVTAIRLGRGIETLSSLTYFSSLETITIPSTITAIEDNTFNDCHSLLSVTVPPLVTSIGDYTFNNCYSIKYVSIPDSVESFGVYTFQRCYALISIVVPDGMTTMPLNIFDDCYTLRHINIPQSVTSIADYAFNGCKLLQSIRIPSGVTSIGSGSFRGCSSLKSVIIPTTVTTIDQDAFNSCASLTSITIPDSVTTIGSSAFYDCVSLKYISIPKSVTSLGASAFNGCSSIKDIVLTNSITNINTSMFSGCIALKHVCLPIGIKAVGVTSFQSCRSLEKVYLPDGVKTIGSNAFKGCSNLKSIELPSELTQIGNSAFDSCTGLKSVVVKNKVINIGSSAFNGCTSLQNINLPNTIISIGTFAFKNCMLLRSIVFPNNVSTIPNYVVQGCILLKNVTLPQSMTGIAGSAFDGCSDIMSLTLPSTVTSIAASAFNNCSALSELHVLATTPPALANVSALSGTREDLVIYVPGSQLGAYRTATNWSNFASKMVAEPS